MMRKGALEQGGVCRSGLHTGVEAVEGDPIELATKPSAAPLFPRTARSPPMSPAPREFGVPFGKVGLWAAPP